MFNSMSSRIYLIDYFQVISLEFLYPVNVDTFDCLAPVGARSIPHVLTNL